MWLTVPQDEPGRDAGVTQPGASCFAVAPPFASVTITTRTSVTPKEQKFQKYFTTFD